VLVTGETGVGKEVIARAVHALGERTDCGLLAVNCGAIPENLIESTLFGHEKGAFTDAYNVHRGFFERAFLFASGPLIADIEVSGQAPADVGASLKVLRRRAAREAEAKVIVEALKQYQGNVSAVARRMQVTPRAIHMKLRSLGINAAAFRNGQNAPQD
jgi:DNA-binding NtrC family response regulator